MLIPGTGIVYNPTLESTLLRVDEMAPERVNGIRKGAKHQVFMAARKAYPTANLVVRDLLFTDFGLTTWEDTTSGSTGWQNHTIAAKTIANGRFVAVTGLRFLLVNDLDAPPILALRWTVGSSYVAMWDIHKAYNLGAIGVTLANMVGMGTAPMGVITESPVIATEDIIVTLDGYVEGTTTIMLMPLEGYVCEIEGLTLKA